jgi:hypothetical protein
MRLLTHGCVSHLPTDGSLPMTDDNNNNTAIDPIQIDEDVLSYTVSDEALEAAAGFGAGALAAEQTYWGLSVLCAVCPPHPSPPYASVPQWACFSLLSPSSRSIASSMAASEGDWR